MTQILLDSAWWLFVTEIDAAAWLGISCYLAICWVAFDVASKLSR